MCWKRQFLIWLELYNTLKGTNLKYFEKLQMIDKGWSSFEV